MILNDPLAPWLALSHIFQRCPNAATALLEQYPDPQTIFQLSSGQLQQLGLSDYLREACLAPPWTEVEADLQWANSANNSVIPITDPRYPQLLKEIADPPCVLFAKGNTDLLSLPQIALVGSRKPTPMGKETALNFAKHLAQSGFTITSGMALGVDGASHQGALAVNGHTIAVTGTGLERVYPKQHHDLAQQISEQGLLLSEFPPQTAAQAAHFPQRNRIISGLSMGVLVVEAALRSGSLITARLATEQGREVFAIPGSIHNAMAKGCHTLIKQGAKLVETVDDIVAEFSAFIDLSKQQATKALTIDRPELSKAEQKMLQYIGFEPTSIDTLIQRSRLTPELVSSMVPILELHGYIQRMAGGYVRL